MHHVKTGIWCGECLKWRNCVSLYLGTLALNRCLGPSLDLGFNVGQHIPGGNETFCGLNSRM